MAGYRHGVYISEVPTSLVPPVTVNSAMPVAFVTAPVHLATDPYAVTNEPKLCYSYAEAVEHFGFSMRKEIWNSYTAPQIIHSQFVLYSVAPVVIVNVLDPKIHYQNVTDKSIIVENNQAILEVDGVLLDTIKINKAGESLQEGNDYTLTFNNNGHVVINTFFDSLVANEITLDFNKLSPEMVDMYDIIGGYDIASGQNKGLQLVGEIYPRFRLVPGQILSPKFSSLPAVAAVMETKASNINGHFKCISLNDVPTILDGTNSTKLKYTDVPAWVTKNNYVSTRQVNCYPKLILGEQEYYYSTQLAGLICQMDSENSGIPFVSPSNRNLKINGICYEGGEEIRLGNEQANFLNGNGVITAINFVRGWTAWGNRTGVYPGNTDIKDSFIAVRRMFDWIANTIVLTYWNKVDLPMTRRHIYTIVDSINIWLNGLTAREALIGGRVEFLEADNVLTDLLDGRVAFRLNIAPPPPMKELEFTLEYDVNYLSTLF